jgi:hypothetical protein
MCQYIEECWEPEVPGCPEVQDAVVQVASITFCDMVPVCFRHLTWDVIDWGCYDNKTVPMKTLNGEDIL